MILDVNSIFIRYSITIKNFFNKFSKLTQNTKINAIFCARQDHILIS